MLDYLKNIFITFLWVLVGSNSFSLSRLSFNMLPFPELVISTGLAKDLKIYTENVSGFVRDTDFKWLLRIILGTASASVMFPVLYCTWLQAHFSAKNPLAFSIYYINPSTNFPHCWWNFLRTFAYQWWGFSWNFLCMKIKDVANRFLHAFIRIFFPTEMLHQNIWCIRTSTSNNLMITL